MSEVGKSKMSKKAILIGNSDGIGLAFTKELLNSNWEVFGISRSKSPISDSAYDHRVADVQSDTYPTILKTISEKMGAPDLCVYCAGIGEKLVPSEMEVETKVFEVNLMGMIKTAAWAIPLMVKKGKGHFIGISSMLDDLLSPVAASYHASKAAFSNYLEGLALAVKPNGVHVTNVRFGFVDTKLPKAHRHKPFMISLDRSTQHLVTCLEKKPIRYTAPKMATPMLKLRKWILKARIL